MKNKVYSNIVSSWETVNWTVLCERIYVEPCAEGLHLCKGSSLVQREAVGYCSVSQDHLGNLVVHLLLESKAEELAQHVMVHKTILFGFVR